MAAVIDLTAEYDIEVVRCSCPRGCKFEARDLKSFDFDPTAKWHIVGNGDTDPEARADLLQKLADAKECTQ